MRITSPSGEPKDYHLNIPMPAKRSRAILVFQGIELTCPGKLRLDLSLNDKHQATHSIDVECAEGEQGVIETSDLGRRQGVCIRLLCFQLRTVTGALNNQLRVRSFGVIAMLNSPLHAFNRMLGQ